MGIHLKKERAATIVIGHLDRQLVVGGDDEFIEKKTGYLLWDVVCTGLKELKKITGMLYNFLILI